MSNFRDWHLFAVAILISFGIPFHYGYQTVLTNPSQTAFLEFLNASYTDHYGTPLGFKKSETIWSSVVAILYAGGAFGSLSIGFVGQKMGRKGGLLFTLILSFVGCATSIVAFFVDSFEVYAVSRFVLGYALGIGIGISALYLNECSPKKCRGRNSMTIGLMVQFGTVVGSVVPMPALLGTVEHWWCIYLVECVFLIIIICILPFLPETAPYLIASGDEAGARKSIKFFHKCDDSEVDEVITEIKVDQKENSKAMTLISVWRDKAARRGTIVGIVALLGKALSGIAVVNAFAVDIFQRCGMSLTAASYGNIALAVVSLMAITLASFIVERFGRRPLLLGCNTAIIVINVAICALMYAYDKLQYKWIGLVLVVVIAMFIASFAIGPGPLGFFITTELVSQEARGAASSWGCLMPVLGRCVLLAIYLPLDNQIGQAFAYSILFVIPMVFCTVFLYFTLPETKNKNFAEVEEEIEKLPSLSRILGRKRISPVSELDHSKITL